MDILYVNGLGAYSVNDNIELRYSLRSIEKFGKNIGRVYVVGYCPEWLSDEVIKIPRDGQMFDDIRDEWHKAANIGDNIYYAIDNSDIGDEFLVSMNDHFYIAEVDFDNYPYYAKLINDSEEIPEYDKKTEKYLRFMGKVKDFLGEQGLSQINFTLHKNMHLSRENLAAVKGLFDQSISQERGAEIFALANNWKFKQEPFNFTAIEDAYVRRNAEMWKVDPELTDCFGLNETFFFTKLQERMAEMYPDRSKYEKEEESE